MKPWWAVAALAAVGVYLIARGSSVVERMARAIQFWESGGHADTISYQNNNPGNLRWFGNLDAIPWAGALGVDSFNHVVFDTYQSGWNALLRQLELAFSGRSAVYSPDMDLYEFFSRYAEANTANYAEYVAGELGVSPYATLRQIQAGVSV